jgi:hypothetical protein
MPDQKVAIVALVVQVHTEAISRVDVMDMGDDSIVAVALGDDRSGVRLVGPLRDVHRLVVEADRQLSRLSPTSRG